MILMNLIPNEKRALIMYPRAFRKPNKEIIVYSIADAKGKWEEETRKFIHHTLRQWVLSRCVSFVTRHELTAERNNAVNKLMLMFSFHQTSRLHILCKRIVQDGEHFVTLFPSPESRYYMQWKEIIAPILMWCDEYQQNWEGFLKNLVRTI